MKRTFKDWVIATRPWSFPASSMSVVVTVAYLWFVSQKGGNEINWANAVLALLMMVFFQAAGNLISDYYDHIRGVDLPGSYNGVRHIQSGMFTPKEILHFGYTLLAVASVLGIIITMNSGIQVLWIGIAGVLLAAFYPWLKYHAMGDYDILLCYAMLPSIGTSFAVTGSFEPTVMLISLTYGLMTVAILHANNTRDIKNDSRAGITTLAIQLGGRTCQYVYAAEMLVPFVLVVVYCLCGMTSIFTVLAFIALPQVIKRVKTMMNAEPNADLPIATLDQQTAQLQLQFSLLSVVGFIIGGLLL